MESKSHCLGLFHPTEFLLAFFFFFPLPDLFSHSSPNALWVCGKLSKAHVSRAEQNPYDAPLLPTLSFDYATITLCLCKEGEAY